MAHSHEREGGYYINGGVEYMVNPRLTVGVDYTYSSYDIDDRDGVQRGAFTPFNQENIDLEMHLISARASIHF